jgi:uncharacterized protein (DUF4415 family)
VREKRIVVRDDSMNKRPLTDKERDQLARLAVMPDEAIDYSDIPKITDEQWALARRGGLYRPLKQPVTIRLDADVLAWFKAHAPKGGYQTEINRVLRAHVGAALAKRG